MILVRGCKKQSFGQYMLFLVTTHIQSKDYALPEIIGQKIQSVYEKKSYTTTLFNMSIEE